MTAGDVAVGRARHRQDHAGRPGGLGGARRRERRVRLLQEGLGVPYQPWITALAQLVAHADEAVLREFVDANGVALARVLPDLARRIAVPVPVPDAGSDVDAERFLILEGVARLLALASAAAPLMVVLDDLHWVDAASLQLLRHLVLSANPMAVTVVGTFRESELSRTHPLTGALADLRRVPGVERLDLRGLDDVDIIDLLGAASGQTVADAAMVVDTWLGTNFVAMLAQVGWGVSPFGEMVANQD